MVSNIYWCSCCLFPRMSGIYRESEFTRTVEMAATTSSPPHSTQLKQVETPRSPFSTRSDNGRLEGTTQVHAAAINGDKQTLSRLISFQTIDLDVGDQFGRSPLMFCVLADRLECAEMLIKSGAQVNLKDRGGRTALHWAAHKGNIRFMKLLLSRGADCREKDNEGQTALHFCTRHKLPKCMALLLRQLTPGEIDDQDKNKRTALHWASSYGNLEHVKMLIKQDSNIGIPDTEGKTPLHWAASSRDREAVSCVKLILETTPSVINWQDYEGRTALHLAVADGNESIVNVLTSVKNCNVSALDNVFRTPLHWAAVLGHSRIVALLLASEADYTSSDSNGATALHYAAQNNFSETVTVFLFESCTDETDLEGRTAFMWAAGKGADEVIKVFLDHNVDIQQEDKTGATALHAAALSGHSSTVKLLLDHGAKLEATDQVKHTPLFRACEMGHLDVVQTLIDCGARVDVFDQEGRSALHWAALGGHAYICQILIKYGVHPNVRDHSARASLHCAAYGGYVNCMSALMEHGAEPNSQDKEGMTCLHWACSKGHLDAVKLLIEYRAFPNHMEFTEDRYTPLDYALMGEHHEVAQYMIEQGALSITGIQDIAALNIQSAFRGYRVRKAFTERKKLLMKHEKLKKEAARKRAAEEGKKSEVGSSHQSQAQQEPPQQSKLNQNLQEQRSGGAQNPMTADSVVQDGKIDKNSDKGSEFENKDSSPPPRVDNQPSTQLQQHQQELQLQQLEENKEQTTLASQAKRPTHQRRPRSKALQRRRRQVQGDNLHSDDVDQKSENMSYHQQKRLQEKASLSQTEMEKENQSRTKSDKGTSSRVISESNISSISKSKRPQEPTESEKVLAHKSHTRSVKLREQKRRQDFQVKVESATKIQRAWRRYQKRKSKASMVDTMQQLSRNAIHKKRVRTTQEEWEKQIAALTIQLAWRKFYRKKLLKALHPNKRQLQMWDPEIVALKQQALIHYIYNEQLQAPFWHPTLKAPCRPLWLRFVPSPAAVSYNFALDQYLPWISELGNQGQINWPQVEEEIKTLQAHCSQQEKQQQQRSPSQYSASSGGRSDVRSNDSKRNNRDSQRPKTTVRTSKRPDSYSSRNSRTRKS